METFKGLPVGTKLRVRSDLEVEEIYDDCRFVSGMENLCGAVVTLQSRVTSDFDRIRVVEDPFKYYWSPSMFVGIVTPSLGLTTLLKRGDSGA